MCYVDDNNLYLCSMERHSRKNRGGGKILFEWFPNNFLNANADSFHLILSTDEIFSIK